MIKYGPDKLYELIPTILNQISEKREDINLGEGIPFPIQNHQKPKGPIKHLRPMIVLYLIRKILSNIVLSRIQPKADKCLSQSQAAYRSSRSTPGIGFSNRWLAARYSCGMKYKDYRT